MGLINGPVPEDMKNSQAKFWWSLMIAFAVVCGGRLLFLDIFGALIAGMMAFLVHYMVKDEFENMPRLLVMFGMLCAFNAFFETLPLMQAMGGRISRRVDPGSMSPDAD